MQINIFIFIFLGAIFFLNHFFTRNIKARWIYLTITSFAYFSLISWPSCIVLFIIGISSYFFGIGIEKNQKNTKNLSENNETTFLDTKNRRFFVSKKVTSKTLIGLGVIFIVGVLLVFRYQIVFLEIIGRVLNRNLSVIELNYWRNKFSFFSTIGIGFYTLQAIGYLFDIYNGRISATREIFLHMAFLSFFPKLLSGPIEKNKSLIDQLRQITPINEDERWRGFKYIVIGLILKNLIADNLAPTIDSAFQSIPLAQSTAFWWQIIITFAVQIYCDFNGYTHVVIGLAQLMGYHLSENFKFPYLSLSPSEFWTRWHITLSTWLREYIFFPLSRSKYLKGKYYINTWITMLLSGMWHGVGWTFIVWGGLHALYISIDQRIHWSAYLKKFTAGKIICLLLMWVQLDISWVFFRASSINQATDILKAMFSFNNISVKVVSFSCLEFIVVALVMDAYIYLSKKPFMIFTSLRLKALEVFIFSLLLVIAIFFRGAGNQFIYFQF
jgi:alginate O-acetyltransferase complex protein AlgI